MFFSGKVKTVLERFTLPPHQFYPAEVIDHGGMSYVYWLFVFDFDLLGYIDFSNSKFVVKNLLGDIIKDVQFMDHHDMVDFCDNKLSDSEELDLTVVYLNEKFRESQFDWWELTRLTFQNVISTRLREAFFEEGITGFESQSVSCHLSYG